MSIVTLSNEVVPGSGCVQTGWRRKGGTRHGRNKEVETEEARISGRHLSITSRVEGKGGAAERNKGAVEGARDVFA